jgi:hypothetical protein
MEPTLGRLTKEVGPTGPTLALLGPSFVPCHIICDYALFWTYCRYAWILVHMMLFRHPMFLKW